MQLCVINTLLMCFVFLFWHRVELADACLPGNFLGIQIYITWQQVHVV